MMQSIFSKKYLFIVLILMAGGFELYVFKEIRHPNVSWHYRLYYIEKKLAFWDHGKTLLYPRATAYKEIEMKRFLSRQGWLVENNITYATKQAGSLYFEAENIQEYRGKLTLGLATQTVQKLTPKLNHTPLQQQIISEEGIVEFFFDPTLLVDNTINQIEFEFTNEANDNTTQSIKLMSFKIE